MCTKPRPSCPIRLSRGTRQPLKDSSAVSASCWPTFASTRPSANPGVPRSTAMRLMAREEEVACGSVRQATITRSAVLPLVMKVLDPSITHASPSRTAVVRRAARSLPPPGSVIAIAVVSSPLAKPGSQRTFCSSVVRSTR